MSGSFQLVDTVSGVQSGYSAFTEWPGLKPFTQYEWYVTVSDGNRTTTGPVWSFTTAGLMGDNDLDCDSDGADLAAWIIDDGGVSLSDFAGTFGMMGCP